MQVRVWDFNRFQSYDAAVAGGGIYGHSEPFQYTITANVPPPPGDFLMKNLRGFGLVPEPSTIALGIVGLASLLLLRRRK